MDHCPVCGAFPGQGPGCPACATQAFHPRPEPPQTPLPRPYAPEPVAVASHDRHVAAPYTRFEAYEPYETGPGSAAPGAGVWAGDWDEAAATLADPPGSREPLTGPAGVPDPLSDATPAGAGTDADAGSDDADAVVPGPGHGRTGRGGRRARPRRRGLKVALGMATGCVLAGAVVTALPGEFVPTGQRAPSGTPDAGASASDDGGGASSLPGTSAEPAAALHLPSTSPSGNSASPSAKASARPSTPASRAPVTTPTANAPAPPPVTSAPPQSPTAPASTAPAPSPSRSAPGSCFLFWCD
ncbi:hypothetical protein [Streptomyces sp. ICBB 8177]|uniref:hypothetical protein n=1 Tax=Streptomyces sp. ICBB 8177 TaxID=563922 RepID=UPI000D67938B|nr:hypothetical protein [Streptomyces sp. ICBB 8177]PWI41884.1 hypothetical protein CK485_24120 [Streptomyces sp. ICBB 8177]